MTDDHGLTVRTLRHEKGRLKMVSRESEAPTPASAINDPSEEMLRDIAKLIAANAQIGVAEIETAKFVVKYIRAWDREQRAKIDERLAPSDPDNYGDPFRMVTRSDAGGLTEWKRG